jgi:hypothetical protein
MTDVCRRKPRGLQRLLQRHSGETGLVVHGFFKRLIYWPPAIGWEVVTVGTDGADRVTLDEVRPGPAWISLTPGEHLIEFSGLEGPLWSDRVTVAEGQALFVAFKPPTWMPFTALRNPQWCLRPLR